VGRFVERLTLSTPLAGSFPISTGARSRFRLGGLHLSERKLLLVAGDLVFLGLALLAALLLRGLFLFGEMHGQPVLRWYWWLVLWALWLPLAIIVRCYDLRYAARPLESAAKAMILAGGASALYLVVPVVSAPLTRSRLAWFLFALFAMVGEGLWRLAYAKLIRQPNLSRRALVIGAGEAGRTLVETIDALGSAAGVEVLGFVDEGAAPQGQEVADRPILGTWERLPSLIQQMQVDELVVAVESPQIAEPLLNILERCWGQGIAIRPVQLYFEEITGAVMVQHIGTNLFVLMNGQDACYQRLWGAVRRVIDIFVGLVGLALLGPLTPLIALAIYLDSPGPILYRQRRVGRGGRTFWLAKFRSMVPNAESNGAVWAKADDGRITRIGRWLRKTHLDELPQVWNLLTGTMTLIGPRPERPEFVRQLDRLLPYYAIRHSVKPGLTGWAQVRYRYGNSVDDALMKLQYDLYYVKHRGPLLDMLILLETIRVVLTLQGI